MTQEFGHPAADCPQRCDVTTGTDEQPVYLHGACQPDSPPRPHVIGSIQVLLDGQPVSAERALELGIRAIVRDEVNQLDGQVWPA